MEQVTYSLYALYTICGYIYIGISKNVQLRLHHHFYKSSNHDLRALIEDPKLEVFSEILYENLTDEQADELEKKLIAQFRNDPMYIVLNKHSGGLSGCNKGDMVGENCHTSKLFDDEIIKIREEYANSLITQQSLAEKYGVSESTIQKIVRGERSPHLTGPITLNRLDRYKVLSDEDIVNMRIKYANYKGKFIASQECKHYNISRSYFTKVLKGEYRQNVQGPLLGKDYTNG